MNNPKDINWINVTKTLCIIGVFFVHCQLYYGCMYDNLNKFIFPFYVNGFFFVSGYLLFWKQLSAPKINEARKVYILTGGGKTLMFNIIFRIIIPSILFSIIEFMPSCFIQGRGIDWEFAFYKTIGGGTYWFTSALVVAELILLLLFCTRQRNIWFYVAFCVTLGVISLAIVRFGCLKNNVWMWKHGLIAMIFLAMGGLYWKYEKQIDILMKWWFAFPLLAAYIVIILFCDYTNPLISTLQIQPLGFLTSVIACILLVWFCKHLPKEKLLTFIGQNSIGFYFMSGALPITLSMFAHKFVTGSPAWMMLIIWVVCLAAAYMAVMIINRWLPWLWDLRKTRKNIHDCERKTE